MCTKVASLFENIDTFGRKLGLSAGFIVLPDQSSQVQSACKAGRPGADDQDVRVQAFPFGTHITILARK